jgi:hypothetical protein
MKDRVRRISALSTAEEVEDLSEAWLARLFMKILSRTDVYGPYVKEYRRVLESTGDLDTKFHKTLQSALEWSEKLKLKHGFAKEESPVPNSVFFQQNKNKK